MHVLIVTPNADLRRLLVTEVDGAGATAEACGDFDAGCARLLAGGIDLLVTDLRLDEYNGLHLIHTARFAGLPARAVAFGTAFDRCLVDEVVGLGAFYEHAHRVVGAVSGYLRGPLPPRDRRDAAAFDPQGFPPRGRRACDLGLGVIRGAAAIVGGRGRGHLPQAVALMPLSGGVEGAATVTAAEPVE